MPDARECCVVKLQPSIWTKYSDTLLQRIEGGALHFDKSVVGTLEAELVGNIFKKENDSAKGVWLRHDAQSLTTGKVPKLLGVIFGALKKLEMFLFPSPKI